MKHAILILILFTGIISAEETEKGKSYLCLVDSSVGYSFDSTTKNWEGKIFRVEGGKYLIRPTTADDKRYESGPSYNERFEYGVWRIGEDQPMMLCKEGVSEANWIHCGGNGNQQFVVNVRSNRFVHVFHGAYMISMFDWEKDEDGEFKEDENGYFIDIDIEDPGGNSPFMDIGKCSAL